MDFISGYIFNVLIYLFSQSNVRIHPYFKKKKRFIHDYQIYPHNFTSHNTINKQGQENYHLKRWYSTNFFQIIVISYKSNHRYYDYLERIKKP